MVTTAIVLKVACGTTLKTTVNGVAVEVECDDGSEEDHGSVEENEPPPHGGEPSWSPPPPPSGSGGVVAYIRYAHRGPSIDLNAVVERFRADQLAIEHLPPLMESDWAVYHDPGGEIGSMGPMVVEADE